MDFENIDLFNSVRVEPYDGPDDNTHLLSSRVKHTLAPQEAQEFDLIPLIKNVDQETLLFPDVYQQQGAHAQINVNDANVIGNIQAIAINLYSRWQIPEMIFPYRSEILEKYISGYQSDNKLCIINRLIKQAQYFIQEWKRFATKEKPFIGLNEAILYAIAASDLISLSNIKEEFKNQAQIVEAVYKEGLQVINRYCSLQKQSLLQYFVGLGSQSIVTFLLSQEGYFLNQKEFLEQGKDTGNGTQKTPLKLAAFHGYADIFNLLINKRASIIPLRLGRHTETVLHLLCEGNLTSQDKMVIELCKHPNINKIINLRKGSGYSDDEGSGTTALHLAARQGNIKKLGALLEAGADINSTDNCGKTCLDYALEEHVAFQVKHSYEFFEYLDNKLAKKDQVVLLLLEKVMPNSEKHIEIMNKICKQGLYQSFNWLLDQQRAQQVYSNKKSFFSWIESAMCRWDIKKRMPTEQNNVKIAVMTGYENIIKQLLNKLNEFQLEDTEEKKLIQILVKLCKIGKIELVEWLIIKYEKYLKNFTSQEKNYPIKYLLHIIIENRYIKEYNKLIELLLKYDNNCLKTTDADKCTALHLAAKCIKLSAVKIILKKIINNNEKDLNDYVNCTDKQGETALHKIVQQELDINQKEMLAYGAIIQLLIETGTDIYSLCLSKTKPRSCYQWAVDIVGYQKIISLFEKANDLTKEKVLLRQLTKEYRDMIFVQSFFDACRRVGQPIFNVSASVSATIVNYSSYINQAYRLTKQAYPLVRQAVNEEGIITQHDIKQVADEAHINCHVDNLKWAEEKNNTFKDKFNEAIINNSPIFLPTDDVTAHYANAAYQENGGELKEGWCLLATLRQGNSYFGAAYWHEAHRSLIIAHRGTDPDYLNNPQQTLATLKADIDSVVHAKIGIEVLTAIRFTLEVIGKMQDLGWHYVELSTIEDRQNNQCYGLTQTGHSLGAWLAQTVSIHFAACHDFHFHTIGFEPPGAKAILEKMCQQLGTDAQSILKQLDITEYFSSLNLVNGCGEHIGHTKYRVYRDWPEQWKHNKPTESEYLLTTHSMYTPGQVDGNGNITVPEGGMLSLFNKGEYLKPGKRVRIQAWPKMLWAPKKASEWKLIWLGKKLKDIKDLLINQSEYWDFFKVANIDNQYEPPQDWITQQLKNNYQLGYCKLEDTDQYTFSLKRFPSHVYAAIFLLTNVIDKNMLDDGFAEFPSVKQFLDHYSTLESSSRAYINFWLTSALKSNPLEKAVILINNPTQENQYLANLTGIELKQAFHRLSYMLCYSHLSDDLLSQLKQVNNKILVEMNQKIEQASAIQQIHEEHTQSIIALKENVKELQEILFIERKNNRGVSGMNKDELNSSKQEEVKHLEQPEVLEKSKKTKRSEQQTPSSKASNYIGSNATVFGNPSARVIGKGDAHNKIEGVLVGNPNANILESEALEKIFQQLENPSISDEHKKLLMEKLLQDPEKGPSNAIERYNRILDRGNLSVDQELEIIDKIAILEEKERKMQGDTNIAVLSSRSTPKH